MFKNTNNTKRENFFLAAMLALVALAGTALCLGFTADLNAKWLHEIAEAANEMVR